ncbi:zinc ribbon domain-containing protein [Azospirillum oryzae]|uniref:zinc ribbon domain-containing protein n=1 Tax=Azospirillum oryzae TaxID=286727 RepID=UPI001178C552|nr:zinc ribbon domain-containing protein [Azospirillum oryzae]
MAYVCGHCGTQVSQRVCTGCGAIKVHGMTASEQKGVMGLGAFAGFLLTTFVAGKFNMSFSLGEIAITAAVVALIFLGVGMHLHKDTIRFIRTERRL